MSLTQRGDALIGLAADGVDMSIVDGVTEMTQMFKSAALLCLMGGNVEDTVTPATKKYEWMGNEDEQPVNQFRSRFLSTIKGRAITSQLLKDAGNAASLDILDGFAGIATAVTSKVTIDSNRRITVESFITVDDGKVVVVENEINQQ